MPTKLRLFSSLFVFFTALAPSAKARGITDLDFTIQTGSIANHFIRQGRVAAHVSLRSGDRPRIVTAFPAGNAGVGLWFDDAPGGMQFASVADLRAVDTGARHGVSAVISVDVAKLTTKHLPLGSVRFLRDYDEGGTPPPEVAGIVSVVGSGVQVQRTSFDGEHTYTLLIQPQPGTKIAQVGASGSIGFERASASTPLAFTLTAMTSETPLTPMPMDELLLRQPATADEVAMANALAFLTYEEKVLAGSWRFLTYFGRDSLLSTYLLRGVAGPAVFETVLAAVCERLSPSGQVAHEEDIGDWAAYRHRVSGQSGAEPIYDYKMVDSDFLLPIVAAAYFTDPARDDARTRAFLQRQTHSGLRFSDALLKNMQLVLAEAKPYAAAPSFDHLIHLRPGEVVGDWRDSGDGLGGGVYPYSVNVAFVPAALHAVEQLASGVLAAEHATVGMAESARQMAAVWQNAGQHFAVSLDHDPVAAALLAFGQTLGLDAALPSVPSGGYRFHALALTEAGDRVAVQHSDQGFSLLLGSPAAADLQQAVDAIRQPFPLGLLTPVGLVVANPAFTTDPPMWNLFTTNHYHGTVVWSWQQAVYLAGLRRQAARRDLPETLQQNLADAAGRLTQVIAQAPSDGREELWTFHIDQGVFHTAPFGADLGDQTESNPVQLWSTVFYGMGIAFGAKSPVPGGSSR